MRIAMLIVGWLILVLGSLSAGDKPGMGAPAIAGAVLLGTVLISDAVRAKGASRVLRDEYPDKEPAAK